MDQEQRKIERQNKIEALPKDMMYYVQDKRSYVGNALMFWAKDGCGYTMNPKNAQKYTYDEIVKFNPRDTDIIWRADVVEASIREYVEAQVIQRSEHKGI